MMERASEEEKQKLLEGLTRGTRLETERDKDVGRKREKRSEAARIEIPDCVDPARRERALQDPERFLRTYFAGRYKRPFGKDHMQMIEAIVERATYGGRQAVAAPRGRGKSEIVKGMLVYLVLCGLVRFPLPVAATTPHAKNLYQDFRRKIAMNDLLLEDFPEVCHPVRELQGAPQRAGKQHVDGVLTGIVWTASDYLSLPHVPGSPYGGVKMAYFGLDAAFRGINIDADRPDFVLVDDPETRESAKSLSQIDDREQILDRDISGMGGDDREIAIVLLTTVQNRYCLSYKVTDRQQKPAWNGMRFGTIDTWPTNMDLWWDYVAKRNADQAAGDEHGRSATQFYLDNREAMDAGAVMLSDHFTSTFHDDGTQLVHSALQAGWNKIADTSMAAFLTEYQNDPEPEEEPETINLTAAKVQSRISDLPQREVPSDTKARTVGIDLGKWGSHWVDFAWSGEACVGTIADYGIAETHGLRTDSDDKAVSHALLASLEAWADEVVSRINPILCLVDSGNWSEVVYEFCRRKGKPFFPAKGWDAGRFRIPKRTETQVPFLNAYARYQIEDRVWLYNFNGEFWKKWLQERFLVSPYDEGGNRTEGSMAIFHHGGDQKRHLSFSHHIVSEEEQLVPIEGKEMKRVWWVKNRNNHWLDASAMACAAAGCVGIRLIPPTNPAKPKPAPRRVEQKVNPFMRDGKPFVATQR